MSSKIAVGTLVAATVCAILATACSQNRPRENSTGNQPATGAQRSVSKTANDQSPPVMGHLKTRQHKITLYGNGRYGIADKNGNMLRDNATLDELKQSDPDVAGILKRAYAGNAGRSLQIAIPNGAMR